MTDSTRPDSPSSGRATEWVMATGNRGKVLELQALFNALSVSLRLQSDFNVTPAEETGATFVENAILKARAAALQTGLPALADDSGLEVDALNGQPGVRSARYGEDGGFAAGDGGNNTRLLESLRNVPEAERGARFHCVLVFMRHAEDPVPLIAQGTWEGRILHEPTGDGGFGYDPLFFIADHGCSAAQLDGKLKNAISHRGQASQQLLTLLRGDLAL